MLLDAVARVCNIGSRIHLRVASQVRGAARIGSVLQALSEVLRVALGLLQLVFSRDSALPLRHQFVLVVEVRVKDGLLVTATKQFCLLFDLGRIVPRLLVHVPVVEVLLAAVGHEGRYHFSGLQRVPVEICKPRMTLNFSYAIDAESSVSFSHQAPINEIGGLFRITRR